MTTFPSVAVVILNFNGIEFLKKFLPSVKASTYPNMELIVADNASTDDSLEYLKEYFPQIRLIRNEKNEGFAKGYNLALRQIQSDYYVLLNSDVEVEKNWIEPIIDLMEKDGSIAACQPKILSYADRSFFEYAGAAGGWMDAFGFPFMRGRIIDHCEKDNGQYDQVAPCFWASGAALFVRSKLYHQLGGLDPYFFAHQEEIDLCWRFQMAGYKIFAQPQSVVYHVGGGTLPPSPRKIFLNYRNNLIMISKNTSLKRLIWLIPFRFLLNAAGAWKDLISGRPDYFWANMKAHAAFINWWLFKKGESVFFRGKKTKISLGVYRGSIVWDYFIKKKRCFSEIIGSE